MRRVLVPEHIAPVLPVAGATVFTFHGETMGTTWSVRLIEQPYTDMVRLQTWQQNIQNQLDTVVAQMSHWRDDSDLARFNRAAPGCWCTLPEAFFEVLTYALSVAADSEGAYDPTAGALVNIWGFGPTGRYDEPGFEPPDLRTIETALSHSGWQHVAADAAQHKIKQPGGFLLDLSAVAKGYSVDRIARYLESCGILNYLVEVGGELRGAGVKPDQQPWWVAFEQPFSTSSREPALPAAATSETIVALHGLSIATSGDYRRCYHVRDRHIPHTIDPRSGHPIHNGVASVTVLHSSCMAADALSTALTVLGADDGMVFAEQHQLAARFLVHNGADFTERTSSAFRAMLQ